MIVYGKRRKKYVLSEKPVSRDYDGAVYSVPADPDVLVKIYHSEYRTSDTEKLVIDTANGKRSMLDESPVDIVYANGRFAGYTFEPSATIPEDDMFDTGEKKREKKQPGMNSAAVMLMCLVAGIGLSALTYFVIFDKLWNWIGGTYCYWNFNGIPMIVGGWALLLTTYFQAQNKSAQTVVFAIVAFILGAALVFGLISLVVWLLSLAWTLAKAILPTVLTIVIVVWLFKSLVGK